MDNELTNRLHGVEQRLAVHSRTAKPAGLTEPDEGGTERWEAGQVWAHVAEFVPYWHGQLEKVVSGFRGAPVPFGRTKTDAGRIGAIEENRNEPIAAHMAATHASLEALEGYVGRLSAANWAAVGMHPIRGEMSVEQILKTFAVDHLEEHADQLDGLSAAL